MSVTTLGALIGAGIDHLSGDDDSSFDGAIKGAIVANVAKVVVPMVATWAIGWAVLRGLDEVRNRLAELEA